MDKNVSKFFSQNSKNRFLSQNDQLIEHSRKRSDILNRSRIRLVQNVFLNENVDFEKFFCERNFLGDSCSFEKWDLGAKNGIASKGKGIKLYDWLKITKIYGKLLPYNVFEKCSFSTMNFQNFSFLAIFDKNIDKFSEAAEINWRREACKSAKWLQNSPCEMGEKMLQKFPQILANSITSSWSICAWNHH